MHFFLHILQIFHVILFCLMPDGGVEGFEIFGLMSVFPVLPYFPESVAFQQGFKQAVFASELESLGYLGEHVAVVYLTHAHPCRLPEVELQHLENLRIREPGSCPGGEKLALGDDVDAGGEWLDGEVACIASCVVCHYNS